MSERLLSDLPELCMMLLRYLRDHGEPFSLMSTTPMRKVVCRCDAENLPKHLQSEDLWDSCEKGGLITIMHVLGGKFIKLGSPDESEDPDEFEDMGPCTWLCLTEKAAAGLAELDFGEYLQSSGDNRSTSHAEGEPLTEQQQAVYDHIIGEGPLFGKEIANHFGISESTFTRHYVPALKRHGIKNVRGLGYYHPDYYRPG